MQEDINPKQTEKQRYVKRKEVGLEEEDVRKWPRVREKDLRRQGMTVKAKR
jgi:hypothetical protein